MPRKPKPKPTFLQRAKEWQNVIGLSLVGLVGATIAGLVYGVDFARSDHPPHASVTRVAQLEQRLERQFQQVIQTQQKQNFVDEQKNQATAASFCSIYASAEAQAKAAVAKRPSDPTAQTDLLLNSQLRHKWCKDAIAK